MKSGISQTEVKSGLKKTGKGLDRNAENLKKIFSCIDLTSLNTADNRGRIERICDKVNHLHEHYPGIPKVAAICVYPSLVNVVRDHLVIREVNIASVGAGFPSSQTFLPVKEMECKLAVDAGANEIDIVISLGRFLEGDLEFVSEEIRRVKEITRPAKLKVILESGLMKTPEDIYTASLTCLRSGADFIKTSTGKEQPAATTEAVYAMCIAIRDFYKESGKLAGIKPAGGISTPEHALRYAGIVRDILGDQWISPALFRIGASRLANEVISSICTLETGSAPESAYF